MEILKTESRHSYILTEIWFMCTCYWYFPNLGSVTDSSHLNSLGWIHNMYWSNISREKCLGIINEKGWKSFGCSGRFQRAINMISESFCSPKLTFSQDASCLSSFSGIFKPTSFSSHPSHTFTSLSLSICSKNIPCCFFCAC